MAARFADYYGILGVDPSVNQRTLRSAYRRLARKYHPDVAKGAYAAKRFLLIREAYDVLSDPAKRRQYDRVMSMWSLRSQPSGSRHPRTVESARPRRGFRVVLDALGIRIDAGVGFGKPSRRPHFSSGRRRKSGGS